LDLFYRTLSIDFFFFGISRPGTPIALGIEKKRQQQEQTTPCARRRSDATDADADDDQGSIDAGKRRGFGLGGDGSTSGARGGDADEGKRRVGYDARTSTSTPSEYQQLEL
jgi:hypothetical protein